MPEYTVWKYGDDLTIERTRGQGTKEMDGKIRVEDLDYARFLVERGCVVDPDPRKPTVQKAFREHGIKSFVRHSRLGYTDLQSEAAVEEAFMEAVSSLRKLGYKRITLKTGSYGMEALAMAIEYASLAGLDLLTIDGSGGGINGPI